MLIFWKIVPAQWFWAVSAYSRAQLPDSNFSSQNWSYVDFQKKWFPRNDFGLFHHTPELSFQIPISAPRSAHTLIFRKNGSRAMILSRFSILQSSASRFQFQLPELPIRWFSKKNVPARWFWAVSACFFRAMILGRFSLLQSSASRSQFWLPKVLSIFTWDSSQSCPYLDFEEK